MNDHLRSLTERLKLTSAERVGFVPYKELQLEKVIVYFSPFILIDCYFGEVNKEK